MHYNEIKSTIKDFYSLIRKSMPFEEAIDSSIDRVIEYVDHNQSVTITVASHEWDDVTQWVYDNWDSCVGIAFLPRFDPNEPGNLYPQMPYETCTKEQYEQMPKVELDEDELISLISLFEQEYEEQDIGSDCNSKGFCPSR